MRASPPSGPDAAGVVHVGRQPVFDRGGTLMGYELLFRGDADAIVATERGAYATSQVLITAFTEIGMGTLVGDRRCFVNLTREFLVGELPLPFDSEQVVLEVLETVTIDDEVIAAVERLVEAGYQIALDDFVFGLGHERLLRLATYVKIDALDVAADDLAATVAACRRFPHVRLVAERLETDGHVQLAERLGFDHFQGYALGHPEVVSAMALMPSKLRRIELLGLLVGADMPLHRVVALVTSDPALSLRLLAAANADALGLPVRVASVHEAVLLLGLDRLRDWAALMLVSDLNEGDEVRASAAVTRARMAQGIGRRMGIEAEAAFTVGLISAAAELLGQRTAELAPRLPLNHDVMEALVAGTGPLGELLALVHAYEDSDLTSLIVPPSG